MAQAAHDDQVDVDAWLADLHQVLRPLVEGVKGVASWLLAADPTAAELAAPHSVAPHPIATQAVVPHPATAAPHRVQDSILGPLCPQGQSRLPGWVRSLGSHSQVTTAARERQRWSDPSFWSLWAPPSAAAGAKDTLLLFARADDCALLIALPSDQSFDLASSERNLLLRVVHHIEAGLRLRMGSPRRRMVLRPNGELARDSSPPASEPFRRVTRTEGEAVESGSPDGKPGASSDNEPLSAPETWLALTEGHLAVVPRTDGQGERHYVFCETDRRPLCALSRAEIQVVAHAARGLSNKLIAHELGVSESFVSRALGRATFRLGCTSRHDLVRMAALLLGPPPERGRPEGLTAAECEVLEMVRSGHSNAEIAAQRATSPRTVANQIARVLRKLGASSRRQVALG